MILSVLGRPVRTDLFAFLDFVLQLSFVSFLASLRFMSHLFLKLNLGPILGNFHKLIESLSRAVDFQIDGTFSKCVTVATSFVGLRTSSSL